MALIPATSTTLLRDISGDALHARWGEFVARYRPMMETYIRERFPHLDADDIIQETLIALVEKLPEYCYVPKETGYFHNYLTGVLRRKALTQCTRDRFRREAQLFADNAIPSFPRFLGFGEAVGRASNGYMLLDSFIETLNRRTYFSDPQPAIWF